MAAAHLQRWAVKLSAYTYNIEFRRTGDHANVDGLSRLLLGSIGYDPESCFNIHQVESLPVTGKQLHRQISKVHKYITKGWPQQVDSVLKPFFDGVYE